MFGMDKMINDSFNKMTVLIKLKKQNWFMHTRLNVYRLNVLPVPIMLMCVLKICNKFCWNTGIFMEESAF